MADEKKLYEIADFILNHADDSELEVVREALKRRLEHRSRSPRGIDINAAAHRMGESVEGQLQSSRDFIRKTVKDFIIKTLKQQAPEISDSEIEVLLEEYLPSEEKKKDLKKRKKKKLPPGAELKMVDQFIRFSTGNMSLDEQAELRGELGEWHEEYWKGFSDKVRGLLTLYFKGRIDSETCWLEVKKEIYDGGTESIKRNTRESKKD